MLTLYGPGGEVAVPLLPRRALELARAQGNEALREEIDSRLENYRSRQHPLE